MMWFFYIQPLFSHHCVKLHFASLCAYIQVNVLYMCSCLLTHHIGNSTPKCREYLRNITTRKNTVSAMQEVCIYFEIKMKDKKVYILNILPYFCFALFSTHSNHHSRIPFVALPNPSLPKWNFQFFPFAMSNNKLTGVNQMSYDPFKQLCSMRQGEYKTCIY